VELDQLAPEHLEPLVGQRFAVSADGADGELSLELESVQRLRPHKRRADPFSLLFRGPRRPVLPQRIYTLTHPGVGDLILFLVPVQGGPEGISYEAIVN
jgi:hypothetical protein